MRSDRHLQLQANKEGARRRHPFPAQRSQPGITPLSRLPIPRHPGPARKVSLAVRASCDRDAASDL
jgi:hypothetical protein